MLTTCYVIKQALPKLKNALHINLSVQLLINASTYKVTMFAWVKE